MTGSFIEGQKALERLLADVRNKTVSHAYILSGPRGIGKKTAARIFAKALHCSGEKKPCGECRPCVLHGAGTHPDVTFVGPEENGNLNSDAVRAAADELFLRPVMAEKKVLIIDGADRMNNSAQNSMLKTFEEPPSYGVVVLLTENLSSLLPTIRSRGVKLELEPFPRESIKAFAEREYPAMRGKSDFVAAYSGGNIGRAREICEDDDFFALRAELITALCGLSGGKGCIFPIAEIFGTANRRFDAAHASACFDLTLSFLGDAMAVKSGGALANADYAEQIRSFAARATLRGISAAAERVSATMAELNASMKYSLWIIDMLIKCWGDIHGNSSRSQI